MLPFHLTKHISTQTDALSPLSSFAKTRPTLIGFGPLRALNPSLFPPLYLSSPLQLFDIFHSVMKHLPGPQQYVFKDMQGLEDFIAKKVEQNQRTLDPNSPRDFIDSFLIRMKEVQSAARVGRSTVKQRPIRLGRGEEQKPTHITPHHTNP